MWGHGAGDKVTAGGNKTSICGRTGPNLRLLTLLSDSEALLLIRYLHGHRQSYGTPQLSDAWGGFEYYIEIEDQLVTRQVNVFENGEILRYTRDHWCDDYGTMFIGKYSLKQKAGRGCRVITENEFNRLWRRSRESPNWENQQRTAKMDQWGSWAERLGVDDE